MYCSQCGNNLPEGATSCNVCGTPINQETGANGYQPSQQSYQTNGYQQPQQSYQTNGYQQPQQSYQTNGYQLSQQQYQSNGYQQPQQQYQSNQYQPNRAWNNLQQSAFTQNNGNELGMKWFKFVIWVQLFLNGILNFYDGYKISVGKHYNLSDYYLKKIYNMYDGLQTIDRTIGIMMMALGIYAIITRFFLSGFKKQGPLMYYLCLIFNILTGLVYLILVKATVAGLEIDFTRTIYNCVILITLLICNLVYFGKRKHLFVN